MNSTASLTASAERAAALVAALRESRRDVESLLASLTPQDLALATVCTGWSVRDEIGHILDATEMLIQGLEQAATGQSEGAFQPRAMAPAMKASAVTRAALLPLAELQTAFQAASARLLALLDARPAGSWDEPVPHPYLNSCSAVQIAGLALLDWLIHPWDIRKALEQQPLIRPEPAALLIAGIITLMPKRLDTSRSRGWRGRFRYIVEKNGQPEEIDYHLDLVLANNAAAVERKVSLDVPADLTFRGQPGDLVLAMVGRRGISRFVQPAPTNETWLPRWGNLWISL